MLERMARAAHGVSHDLNNTCLRAFGPSGVVGGTCSAPIVNGVAGFSNNPFRMDTGIAPNVGWRGRVVAG